MNALLLLLSTLGQCQFEATARIESEQPIAVIVAEGVWGYVVRDDSQGVGREQLVPVLRSAATAIVRDGWLPVIARAWHVLGFVLWDRAGEVTYAYEFDAGGMHVRRWACIRNGNVQTSVVLTGDLGPSPHPKVTIQQVALILVANEMGSGKTEIHMTLRVDLCMCFRLRIAHNIAHRIACGETSERLGTIEQAGRDAVASGRSQLESMIRNFVEKRR